jgi:hypothetical protein
MQPEDALGLAGGLWVDWCQGWFARSPKADVAATPTLGITSDAFQCSLPLAKLAPVAKPPQLWQMGHRRLMDTRIVARG